jgi:V/A-type H+-transporting ATPase subunit D
MSTPGLRSPPGRAGRLWLQRRLETAQRGADLLDRKLRILQGESSRLRVSAAQTSAEWDRCQADAAQWLLRAGLLDGQRSIRLSAAAGFAEVTISYTATMGTRFPADVTFAAPPSATWAGPVLTAARQAHRAALAAAVRHAVAAEALRVIEGEALATRHRLRAVRDRWIPRLEQALAEVTLAIEEQERSDAARLRLSLASPLSGEPSHHSLTGIGSQT